MVIVAVAVEKEEEEEEEEEDDEDDEEEAASGGSSEEYLADSSALPLAPPTALAYEYVWLGLPAGGAPLIASWRDSHSTVASAEAERWAASRGAAATPDEGEEGRGGGGCRWLAGHEPPR